MIAMIGRWIALGILGAFGCFALGLAAARYFGGEPAAPPLPPRIVIDPASIQLLPDASLRLDLPRGFDAGL
jgi:hypothetical protein